MMIKIFRPTQVSAKYTFEIGVLLLIKVNKILLPHLYTKVIMKENLSSSPFIYLVNELFLYLHLIYFCKLRTYV